jgi:hypothetical protein
MDIYVYKEGMTEKEQKDGAYFERNMLALLLAKLLDDFGGASWKSGWYYDTENNWDGWKRVISIANGSFCFHIPDDFNIGKLPEIEPNWDGHTTEEKWKNIMGLCGIKY